MINDDFNSILNSNIDWAKFKNKTILITGANGFLPAYMTKTLLMLNDNVLRDNPCKVIVLARNEKHTKNIFSEYINKKELKIIIQDVSSKINIFEKINFIIHAASLASPKYYKISPVDVILPNIIGTKNMLELGVKNNTEGLLYFSSGEVYGELPDDTIINENTFGHLNPTSVRACYGESKRMGENLCISYGHQYDIPVKIVRPFHTYGPGMKLDDGRVFSDFVNNIVSNENIELKSDGSFIRPFCYLADATIAFFKVLLDGKRNEAYNVANPDCSVSIKELAIILTNLFPEKKLMVSFKKQNIDYLKSSVKGNIVNINKLKKLGYQPTTSIENGFKKTIRSYE